MTLSSKVMSWLNENRNRSYPMDRDAWRAVVGARSPLDCVVLDAAVFDPSPAAADRALILEYCDIGEEDTEILFSYGGIDIPIWLSGGSADGADSFERIRMTTMDECGAPICMSFTMSSHKCVLDRTGTGMHDLRVPVMPARIIRLSNGGGVNGILCNGSKGVQRGGMVSGDVVLEDGYRTSPVISNGKILVKVGVGYGYDPCKYEDEHGGASQCGEFLFYFCGQDATGNRSGNIVIEGGRGVVVSQGDGYLVKSGSAAGSTVPCIEISAATELMSIYRPGFLESDPDGGDDGGDSASGE